MGDNELTPRKYSDVFDECFSFYLSIGMTYEQYWDGAAELPKYYREAHTKKQEMKNHEAWLYGLYVYDAVTSAMSMLNKDKHSHKSYATKPYSFSKEDREEKKEAEVIEAQAQAEVWMKSWAAATQKMFDKK